MILLRPCMNRFMSRNRLSCTRRASRRMRSSILLGKSRKITRWTLLPWTFRLWTRNRVAFMRLKRNRTFIRCCRGTKRCGPTSSQTFRTWSRSRTWTTKAKRR
uniref:(northern house mosquito) hypothetical protein n=1 Tax=Culex pipiens TaxID=7175 RepID=A0A8D8MPR7_CULPI